MALSISFGVQLQLVKLSEANLKVLTSMYS